MATLASPERSSFPTARVDEGATAALRYAEVRLAVEHARHTLDVAEADLAAANEACQRAETLMLNRIFTSGPEYALDETLAFGAALAAARVVARGVEAATTRLGELQQEEALTLERLASLRFASR